MANSVMRKYEGMFLVDSARAASDWDAIVKAIETIMERAGAQLESLKKWDDRRLCYPIGGHTRGTYVLTYFQADPGAIAGMERDVQISEEILRVLILNAEKIPAEVKDSPTPLQMAEQQARAEAEEAARQKEQAEADTAGDSAEVAAGDAAGTDAPVSE